MSCEADHPWSDGETNEQRCYTYPFIYNLAVRVLGSLVRDEREHAEAEDDRNGNQVQDERDVEGQISVTTHCLKSLRRLLWINTFEEKSFGLFFFTKGINKSKQIIEKGYLKGQLLAIISSTTNPSPRRIARKFLWPWSGGRVLIREVLALGWQIRLLRRWVGGVGLSMRLVGVGTLLRRWLQARGLLVAVVRRVAPLLRAVGCHMWNV